MWETMEFPPKYKGIPCPTPSGGDIKIFFIRHHTWIHTLKEEEEKDEEGRRASTFAPAAAVLRSLDASVILDGFLCLWVCDVAIICLPPLVFLHVSLNGRWGSGEQRGGGDGGWLESAVVARAYLCESNGKGTCGCRCKYLNWLFYEEILIGIKMNF